MGNYLETLKNIKKDKSKEKLIYLLILLIILFVSFSLIFNDSDIQSVTATLNGEEQVNNVKEESTSISYYKEVENNLTSILNQIEGIKDASVMITFSNNETIVPIYNTKEEETESGKVTEKEVVYNEGQSNKDVLVETIYMPEVEGVIVVATGASNINVKSDITEAIAYLTDIPSYKVQIFERGE